MRGRVRVACTIDCAVTLQVRSDNNRLSSNSDLVIVRHAPCRLQLMSLTIINSGRGVRTDIGRIDGSLQTIEDDA
jgi:hypothetical protein